MQLKIGQIVITQGNEKSWVSRAIHYATKSWWTHGFVVISNTEGVEAKFPKVTKLKLSDRIQELESQGRDYVVMEYPDITEEERLKVAVQAESYVGTLYDIWNAIAFLLFRYWVEGGRRLVCSGLMAKSHTRGIQKSIFPREWLDKVLPDSLAYRRDNLEDDYCTPDEVLRYSILKEIYRTHLHQ